MGYRESLHGMHYSHRTITACMIATSLVLHAGILWVSRSVPVAQLGGFDFAPHEDSFVVQLADEPPSNSKEEEKTRENLRELEVGTKDGKGEAPKEAAGDEEQIAKQWERTQPALSKDPVGPDPRPHEPVFNTSIPDELALAGLEQFTENNPGEATPPAPMLPPAPSEPSNGGAVQPPPPELALLPLQQDDGPSPIKRPRPAVAASNPSVEQTPRASAPPPKPSGSPQRMSRPSVAADPAPLSDSEMDAFSSKRVKVDVSRNGHVEAAWGRQVKTARPMVTIKGWIDIAQLPNPSVEMELDIDATGKVMNVLITKSGGSNEIDVPAELAAWKFWFEPTRDVDGNTVPDHIKITFSWH